jgi:hypothetical protein
MCQCFPSIKYLNGQVFVRAPLSAVTALIPVVRSFAGKNVHGKWLVTVMVIIINEKIVLGRCLLQNCQDFLSICAVQENFS